MDNRPDVRARELLDEFFEKQDEPQYMRNVLSGLSGILLVSVVPSFRPLSINLERRVLQRQPQYRYRGSHNIATAAQLASIASCSPGFRNAWRLEIN